MLAAATSRWNAGCVVVAMTLQDLEGSIGWFTNDFVNFSCRNDKKVASDILTLFIDYMKIVMTVELSKVIQV
jgi:hypothetical protein